MAQLRQHFAEFEQRGVTIVVVGPEPDKAFEYYWQSNKLKFVGLPDPRGSVLRLYGQEVNLFKLGRMPAQVLVDRHGIVRFAYYGASMTDYSDISELLQVFDRLNEPVQA